MKNEGITQGPLFVNQDSAGAYVVRVGPGQYDQEIAYFGTGNPHVESGSPKGNAQLFSAASDLLVAAQAILNELDGEAFRVTGTAKAETICDYALSLRHAIAKAEGCA